MMYNTDKSAVIGQLQSCLFAFCETKPEGTDLQSLLQITSGLLIETHLLFESPEEGLMVTLQNISRTLNISQDSQVPSLYVSPAASELDCQAEQGRLLAREILEDWNECSYEFRQFIETFAAQSLILWEEAPSVSRQILFGYLYENAIRGMAFEIAAQELCGLVIDELIGGWGWTLLDAVTGLSALSGQRLAQSLEDGECQIFCGSELPEHLDRLVHVMTQEAIRYGTPAGSDWRFGLAANDVPPNPPFELLCGVEPYARKLLSCLPLNNAEDQAAACAKAAGRMIAVASSGEVPEFEPSIVKPLAMAAMSESYKCICVNSERISV
jgi:hypothetical protein